MSWQLAAFGLLALALGSGFAWYERTRPDARIVALVGTLAAFAALGRIAFAPVPNVKPTTDIVFIAGYALGAGPGFAVGALAGLSSNFFFGQGPWTPWQMAAWGATGLIGAGVARVMAGRSATPPRPLGRWPLAVICGVTGFAFTVTQDAGDWVSYSDHSVAQLLAYIGQGLGFDAIHAAGCVVFALAIGPALTRSVQRFARRLQVTWIEPGPATVAADGGGRAPGTGMTGVAAAVGVMVLVGLGAFWGGAPSRARAAQTPVVARATAYLLRAENGDGGFGQAPGQPSDQLYTGWAALGLASAGDRLATVHGGGLIAYVRAGAAHPSDVGALERTMLVAGAAGLPARSFGATDLVAALLRHIGANGSVSGQVNLTAFAVLALRAAGEGVSDRTFGWLVSQQDRDGGYSFAGAGGGSDVDDTGAVLEALAGDPAASGARARAVTYLRRQQDPDGGLPSQPGSGSNTQSTAWAIQGLDAAGIDPATLHSSRGATPVSYLVSLAAPSGAIAYSHGVFQTPVWVTGEALMALEGRPLPIAAPAPAPTSPRPAVGSSAHAAKASDHGVRHPAHAAARSAHRRRGLTHRGHVARRPTAAAAETSASAAADGVALASAAGAIEALVLAPIGLG